MSTSAPAATSRLLNGASWLFVKFRTIHPTIALSVIAAGAWVAAPLVLLPLEGGSGGSAVAGDAPGKNGGTVIDTAVPPSASPPPPTANLSQATPAAGLPYAAPVTIPARPAPRMAERDLGEEIFGRRAPLYGYRTPVQAGRAGYNNRPAPYRIIHGGGFNRWQHLGGYRIGAYGGRFQGGGGFGGRRR